MYVSWKPPTRIPSFSGFVYWREMTEEAHYEEVDDPPEFEDTEYESTAFYPSSDLLEDSEGYIYDMDLAQPSGASQSVENLPWRRRFWGTPYIRKHT